ncbi:hypothetical protein [Nocardioides bigeumensis]|uniref:Uncharacterized protein n=1 Tax=Nocardioides bigeumensis TaxID=433657 RepID=A0ABP5KJT3_9ACTN
MRRLTALLVLVLSFVLSPTIAQASAPTEEVTQDDVVEIVSSDDPEAAFAALPSAEQEEVRTMVAEAVAPSTESGRTVALTPSAAQELGLKPPKTKAATLTAVVAGGCWSHYYYTNWTLYGASIANSWMTLNWCGSKGSITSYSISNVGGSGSGLSYQGNTKSTRNVGWEVRGVTTHSWSFWIGGISKCMQVRGGATGLYSRSVSCSM